MSIEFLITSLIVVVIPGTGVIYTVSLGLFQGAKASMFAAIGCTAGIIPHLTASIIGLTVILHMSSVVFQVIKLAGVAYLLYLAWSMWRESGAINLNNSAQKKNAWDIASKGFLINILNPKLSLFFLAFLPQFIPSQVASPLFYLFMLSGVFMLMTLVVFISYGLFANSVRAYIINSPKIIRSMQRGFATIFAVLGVKLAMTE